MSFNLGQPPVGPPPYSPWKLNQLRIIERAIAVAWGQIMGQPHFVKWAQTAVERDITVELQKRLVCLLNTREVRGFSAATFSAPIRGQEVENYSGEEKEKRPDLTFNRLAARPVATHHAQFYECKILGRGRTLDDYHGDGVMRFVDGRYAWGMPHAGMIAYVSPPPSPLAEVVLADFWKWDKNSKPRRGLPTRDLALDTGPDSRVVISVHARSFPLNDGAAPGEIALRHLWLSTTPR